MSGAFATDDNAACRRFDALLTRRLAWRRKQKCVAAAIFPHIHALRIAVCAGISPVILPMSVARLWI
jgi:hypothetical protein